jgi:hypothetical protein
VISGGNIELQMLSKCFDRALYLWGRMAHFTVSLPLGTDEFMKMLKILRTNGLEVVSASGMPNVDCTPNHIRYSVIVDIPNPVLFDQVQERFGECGWKTNITPIHASDE